jgi:uncharacterized membrane protein
MAMTKPGFLTSEFWATAASQLLTLLALVGLISASDLASLQDAVGKCLAAAALFATNAWVVVRYIQSRTRLKQSAATR